MPKITHLPKPDELAYNLNKIQVKDYSQAMKTLAFSVIEYSDQIDALGLIETIDKPLFCKASIAMSIFTASITPSLDEPSLSIALYLKVMIICENYTNVTNDYENFK